MRLVLIAFWGACLTNKNPQKTIMFHIVALGWLPVLAGGLASLLLFVDIFKKTCWGWAWAWGLAWGWTWAGAWAWAGAGTWAGPRVSQVSQQAYLIRNA